MINRCLNDSIKINYINKKLDKYMNKITEHKSVKRETKRVIEVIVWIKKFQ